MQRSTIRHPESWRNSLHVLIACTVFLLVIAFWVVPPLGPHLPPLTLQPTSRPTQPLSQHSNNTKTNGVWNPSPNSVDNNGGDIYFFFHLHKAGGTLVCHIAKGLELSTDPNSSNCNIEHENNFLYKDMSQLIDYSVSKGINFIANESFMPKLGTFVKYMQGLDYDSDGNNISMLRRIHLATILRHPIDLLLSEYMHVQESNIWHESNGEKHYSGADMFNETHFMNYIKHKHYDNGKLLYRYSGWCRDDHHKIVDNKNRYDLCSNFANEWFDQFDIICFMDEMDRCIENLIKNYFCKFDKDGIIGECHVDHQDKHIDNVIKYYRTKMFGTKQRVQWKTYLKNEMDIQLIYEELKYEIMFYNEAKTRYGKGKFPQTINVNDVDIDIENRAQYY